MFDDLVGRKEKYFYNCPLSQGEQWHERRSPCNEDGATATSRCRASPGAAAEGERRMSSKDSRTVRSGGKPEDSIKGLPIAIYSEIPEGKE